MGLIKTLVNTAKDSVTGALAQQWKEAIHCPTMSNEVILRRGVRMNGGQGANKGDPDIITNGSIIMVEENTCMLTIDNGKVTNIVTEPGAYEFDSSSSPSVFAGEIADSLKDVLKRFTFGGTAAAQQRVLFINLMPLPGIPFGTSNPMPYFDPAYNTTVELRFFGTFEIKVADAEMAVKFYQQVACKGQQSGDLFVKDIFRTEQYKKEFMQAMLKSLNTLSSKGVRYSQISAYLDDITHESQTATKSNWFQRGFEITNVAMSAVTITDESKSLLGDRMKADTMLGDDVQRAVMTGSVARGIEAAGGNEGGAMMGFMGLGMAQTAGGNVLGGFGEAQSTQQAQQMQQAGMPQPAAPQFSAVDSNSWICSCGSNSVGNFCAECGSRKPQPAGSWTCSCGESGTGKFCSECGSKKPEASNSDEWSCACGAVCSGKFCAECGKAR
jgi:membrane protease subunit (stomatin/prohibitin family)